MIEQFSWVSALGGGGLLGLAAVVLMATLGKVAGISGMVASTLSVKSGLNKPLWPLAFVLGLIASGLTVHWFIQPISLQVETSLFGLIASGLLVGVGTRLGNGCTSGHGVCGLSRFSLRSLVAVCVFMGVAVCTVFITRHVFEGGLL